MSTTVSDIRTAVRYDPRLANTINFPNALVLQSVNLVLQDICNRINMFNPMYLRKAAIMSIGVTSGQQYATLPTDCGQVIRVEWGTGESKVIVKPLPKMSDIDTVSTSSEPVYFWVDSDKIWLSPAPNITNGHLASFTVTTPGSGYVTAPTVTLTGGGNVTTAGTATASISGGAVVGVAVTTAGSGYVTAPTVAFSGSGGAVASAALDAAAQLYVYYIRKHTDLSSDTDTMILPDDWKQLVVMKTQIFLYRYYGAAQIEPRAYEWEEMMQTKLLTLAPTYGAATDTSQDDWYF